MLHCASTSNNNFVASLWLYLFACNRIVCRYYSWSVRPKTISAGHTPGLGQIRRLSPFSNHCTVMAFSEYSLKFLVTPISSNGRVLYSFEIKAYLKPWILGHRKLIFRFSSPPAPTKKGPPHVFYLLKKKKKKSKKKKKKKKKNFFFFFFFFFFFVDGQHLYRTSIQKC